MTMSQTDIIKTRTDLEKKKNMLTELHIYTYAANIYICAEINSVFSLWSTIRVEAMQQIYYDSEISIL